MGLELDPVSLSSSMMMKMAVDVDVVEAQPDWQMKKNLNDAWRSREGDQDDEGIDKTDNEERRYHSRIKQVSSNLHYEKHIHWC